MRVLRVLLLVAIGVPGALLIWLEGAWPPPSWYGTHWPAHSAFMRMRETQTAVELRYEPVLLDSISEWLPRAATVAEDDAFFQHRGIDWRAVRQAMGYRGDTFVWSSARDRAELRRAFAEARRHREGLRGASTITQQLAKNLYLSPSRNPLRKFKEAALAYRLEWALPKERILELYLNVAEFGPNLWGVEAASQAYFHRGAAGLGIEQAALLVATLPHPLTSNPALHPGRTRARQQLILRKLRGENVEVPREEPEELDSLARGFDSLRLRLDSMLPHPDTLSLPLDTVVVPPLPPPVPVDTLPPPDTAPRPAKP